MGSRYDEELVQCFTLAGELIVAFRSSNRVDPTRRDLCPARIDVDPVRNDLVMAREHMSPAQNELADVWNRSPAGRSTSKAAWIDVDLVQIDVDPARIDIDLRRIDIEKWSFAAVD